MMKQADPQSVIRNPQCAAALPLRILFSVTLVVLLAALISGCSVEARKARYLARGEEYFNSRDYEKAKIEYVK